MGYLPIVLLVVVNTAMNCRSSSYIIIGKTAYYSIYVSLFARKIFMIMLRALKTSTTLPVF